LAVFSPFSKEFSRLNNASRSPEFRRLCASVDCAVAFLSSQIRKQCYTLAAISSDGLGCPVHEQGRIFPGFYIAAAMHDRMSPEEAQGMLACIDAENRDDAWGDCLAAPVDSDDTAFALRTLRLFGRKPSNKGLLSFYQAESRLFPTFKSKFRVRIEFELSLENNAMAHPEVAANIYLYLWSQNRRAYIHEELIEVAQTSDGDWRSYFYPSRYYATYLFLDLLARMGRMQNQQKRGLIFVRETQNRDGSWGSPANPYETALALIALQTSAFKMPEIAAGMEWLLQQQQADGSWNTGQIIWKYPASPISEWVAYDRHRVLATAFCLRALRNSIE
jgi:hypothetical protein